MQNSTLIKKFNSKYPTSHLQINGKDWEYIVTGKGKKAFLMLPGGLQNAQVMFEYIKAFEDSYKIIVPTIHNVDSIEEFNISINTILSYEKIDKIYLSGLSLTGLLAQSYLKRNKEKVEKIILSHATVPTSKIYKQRIILPLRFTNLFIHHIPIPIIKFLTKFFSKRVQMGLSNNSKEKPQKISKGNQDLRVALAEEFYDKYLDKRFLQTVYKLHFAFAKEQFNAKDFTNWKGKMLILRTDNDPLMQDEGEFKKIYPQAKVYTFHGSGHLTFHLQFPKMVEVMKNFLRNENNEI